MTTIYITYDGSTGDITGKGIVTDDVWTSTVSAYPDVLACPSGFPDPNLYYVDLSGTPTITLRGSPLVSQLDLNKATKTSQAQGYEASLIAQGYTYNSVLYDVSPTRIMDITAQGSYAGFSNIDGTTWPWDSGFYWVAMDGSQHTFAAATDFIGFVKAVNGYILGVRRNTDSIVAAIAGAANQTALDAIDITAGYPTPHN